ncbi:MAG: type 4a pilus biogenesis protein PilO [Patescibacteria group bacterium]
MADAPEIKITPQPSPQATGQRTPDVGPKPKRPSKIFTDYYGSVFLLLIAAYVAVGFFVIKPKMDDNKQLEAQARGIRKEIENDRSYFDGLSRSVSAAQSIDPIVLQKVDQALPHAASVPDLLVQLSSASAFSGVTLSNIVFENAAKAPGGGTASTPINITLSVAAKDYTALKKFLNTLETSLRIFDVQTIAVSGFGEDMINFNLQLRSYFYPTAAAKL